jgi:hypothetical protein
MVFFMMVPVAKQNSGNHAHNAARYKMAPFGRSNLFFGSRAVQAADDDSAAIAAGRRRITSWAIATMSRDRTCLD